MISFIVCRALLITGYLTYGKIVDNTFGPDDRETPAVRINDGASIAEVTGKYLGHTMQNVMRVFSVVLLIMVGTVFAVGPAGLIVTLCKNSGVSGLLSTTLFWLILILVYYFIATFISIDKIIGKVYPLFGMCLIIMAVGVIIGIGNAVGAIDYTVIWRYFSWTNQTLAMIVLWAAAMYLFTEKKNFWIAAVPATFMSAVSCTYFILAPECLGSLLNSKTADGAVIYNTAVAYPIGIVFAILLLALFIRATKKHGTKKNA